MMRKEGKYRKGFISVKKYAQLKCHNCGPQGKVYGGAKKEEAKRVSNCYYCGGTKVRTPKPMEMLIDAY